MKEEKSQSNAIQLIHIGNLIHQKGIVDLSSMPNYGNSLSAEDDLITGNKIALLVGDFLIANTHRLISEIRDSKVQELVSRAICDVVDASFIGSQDKHSNSLPFEPGMIPNRIDMSFENSEKPVKLEGRSGTAEDEWMIRQILHRGFLIAKGCQSSAILSGRGSQSVQKNCFELGKSLFLTWQAFVELKSFRDTPFDGGKVNLTSAPFLFHLSHEPSLYKEICDESNSESGLNHASLHAKVVNGRGMAETEKLLEKLKSTTHGELSSFPASQGKSEIENILSDF
jgi:geranylgeranyl pyrophosphate synthase